MGLFGFLDAGKRLVSAKMFLYKNGAEIGAALSAHAGNTLTSQSAEELRNKTHIAIVGLPPTHIALEREDEDGVTRTVATVVLEFNSNNECVGFVSGHNPN